MYSTVQSSTLQ